MNTDTPETDSHYYPDFEMGGDVVLADFARKLERERDEARDAANKAKAYKRVLKETNAQLKRQRDEARGQVGALVDRLGKTQERMIDAERKIAEAGAEMIRWMSIAEGRGRTDETLSNQ